MSCKSKKQQLFLCLLLQECDLMLVCYCLSINNVCGDYVQCPFSIYVNNFNAMSLSLMQSKLTIIIILRNNNFLHAKTLLFVFRVVFLLDDWKDKRQSRLKVLPLDHLYSSK